MALTVLYDADCGFCTRSIDVLMRSGARAKFQPLQTADLITLGIDPRRATREMPAVLTNGDIVYGAQAFRAALSSGPRWMRSLAALMRCSLVSALARVGYHWVATHRHHLPGGTPTCAIPRPRHLGR